MHKIIVAISLKAILFYLWHRKKLKNPNTLASAFLRSDNGDVIGIENILQSIQAIFDGVEVNRGKEIYHNNPLLHLQEGDIVFYAAEGYIGVWNCTSGRLKFNQIQSL